MMVPAVCREVVDGILEHAVQSLLVPGPYINSECTSLQRLKEAEVHQWFQAQS